MIVYFVYVWVDKQDWRGQNLKSVNVRCFSKDIRPAM